jgi:hypothetical protein
MMDKIYDSKTKSIYILEIKNEEITLYNNHRPEEKWQGDERVASFLAEIEHKPGSPLFKDLHHAQKYVWFFKTLEQGKR